MSKSNVLAYEIPYWEVANEPFPHVVLYDGSISTGLELIPLDIECFDAASVNNLALTFRTFLNSLQEKTSAQFFLRVHSDYRKTLNTHEANRADSLHPVILDLDEARLALTRKDMQEGALYGLSLYLILKEPSRLKRKFDLFSSSEKFSALTQQQYQETLEALAQNVESAKASLEAAGISLKPLSRDEILGSIYTNLNPSRATVEPTPHIPASKLPEISSSRTIPQTTRERLVFGDLIFGTDDFVLNSVAHRIITLKNMPEVTYAGMLASILRLPFHYELTLSIEIRDQSKELAKLQSRRRMAHSLAAGSGGRPADLENESKLSSTEELLREILNSGQKIFSFQFRITLKTANTKDAKRDLERMTRELLSRIRSLAGAEAVQETVGAWKIFKNDLPFAPMEQIRGKRIKTNNLADFLPLFGPRRGDDDPVVILHNRLGGLVSFNPFDPKLPNYNSLVTGSSGAGKSFLNNFITLQQMTRKNRLFVIDIGGSYKKLTEALDGEYFEINLSDRYAMNPFVLGSGEKEPGSQKLKSLVAIVEQMVTEDDRTRLSKMDRVLLEKTILETYRKLSKPPKLSDLKTACEKASEPELKKIGTLLYPWTEDRPFGKLLDRDSGITSDKTITTFDLKGLSQYPDLQSVMILILTDFILREVEADKSSFKRIILDEAWELLKSQAAASFMEYCARTLRKTGSGITFITQGLEEIVASPIGAAIINNTATKLILLQRGDTKTLVNTLKLNPQELALIQSLRSKKGEYSEALLIEGEERQVIRVYPHPLEYWLSTSDAKDNLFLQELMETQVLPLWEAVKSAASTHPWGVAHAEPKTNQSIEVQK